MASFAFSPIRGRPKNSEETKAPVRKGSPIPTDTQKYKMYAGEPTHPFNLKGDTIKKIINGCDMMSTAEILVNMVQILHQNDFTYLCDYRIKNVRAEN